MGRAQGKHGPRGIFGDETEGQRREEGIGEPRDIPGGRRHVANPPLQQQKVPVPESEWPFRRALLAHGVHPDEAGRHDRKDPRLSGAQGERGARLAGEEIRTSPVPVYIVEGYAGARVIRTAAPRSITCPASTAAEPARVCSRNPDRINLLLLNEDTATDIRFAVSLGTIAAGAGALLPWPANTYLSFPTQDEVFAIGATGSGTPKLSIIEVFEEAAG